MSSLQPSPAATMLEEEMDFVMFLCSQIDRLLSNIDLSALGTIPLSSKSTHACHESLLAIGENIEGAALLLEALISSQQRDLPRETKLAPRRLFYDRDTLIRLRQSVSSALSNEMKVSLEKVIERDEPTNRRRKQVIRNIFVFTSNKQSAND
jgi:hypothetical protein